MNLKLSAEEIRVRITHSEALELCKGLTVGDSFEQVLECTLPVFKNGLAIQLICGNFTKFSFEAVDPFCETEFYIKLKVPKKSLLNLVQYLAMPVSSGVRLSNENFELRGVQNFNGVALDLILEIDKKSLKK